MDDMDKMISRVMSEKIDEPKEYRQTIEEALYKNEKTLKRIHFYKVAVAVCFSFIILSGIVYAGYTIINNVFNDRKGVETAINNNYIMDGLETYEESNGVSIKINNMLIDDHNLDISFNVKFEDGTNVEDIENIRFEKVLICDEENRVLFYDVNEKVVEDFIKNNGLSISISEFEEKFINTSLGINIRNRKNNQLDFIYNLSAYDETYPRSKEIVIYGENIILNDKIKIDGKWQIKQKIEEKFYQREKITYNYETNNTDDIISLKVETYATGTDISIEMKKEKSEEDELKEKLLNIEGQAKNEDSLSQEINEEEAYEKVTEGMEEYFSFFKDIYIENENGMKFYMTKDINAKGEILMKGDKNTVLYFNTLDMTIYDCTNKITLNFMFENKKYSILLEK